MTNQCLQDFFREIVAARDYAVSAGHPADYAVKVAIPRVVIEAMRAAAEPPAEPFKYSWSADSGITAPGPAHAHMWSGAGPDAYCVSCLVRRGSGEL